MRHRQDQRASVPHRPSGPERSPPTAAPQLCWRWRPRPHPVFAVLSDAEGTAWLTPADLAAAEPDPFCHLEQDWHRLAGCPAVTLGLRPPRADRERRT